MTAPPPLPTLRQEVTEHSKGLRLVLHANEEGGARQGGPEMETPTVMLCHRRAMTAATLQRQVDAHREALKDKSHEGQTLLHNLCSSSAERPHSEQAVEAVSIVLDAYK